MDSSSLGHPVLHYENVEEPFNLFTRLLGYKGAIFMMFLVFRKRPMIKRLNELITNLRRDTTQTQILEILQQSKSLRKCLKHMKSYQIRSEGNCMINSAELE